MQYSRSSDLLVRLFGNFTILLGLVMFSGQVIGQINADSLKIAYQEQWRPEAKVATLIRLLHVMEKVEKDTFQQEQWLQKGERLARRFPNELSTLDWFLYRSSFEIRRGNYKDGYRYGLKGIELARQLNRPSSEAHAAYKTAFAISEYDYEASIPFYLECIRISRELNDSVRLADCLIDYSDAVSYTESISEEAYLEVLSEARIICEALELGEPRMTNYIHLITYYVEDENLESANEFLALLRDLTDSLALHEDSFYLTAPLEMEVLILSEQDNYEAAIPIAKQTLKLYIENQELANLSNQYETLLDLYEETGRYREGYELLQEYQEYQEEDFSNDKRLLVSQLNEKYQTLEKEELIETQQSELARANRRYLLLGGSVLLFGSLLVLVFLQSRRIQRNNTELSRLTAETASQNDRLNTLLGELHHRVKNNLQLISSLLRLQARKTSDDSIKSALSVGQQRVEAMSIIHQRLYQQENLTVVNLQSVMKELIQRTDFTYRSELTPIKMEISMNPQQLDATQAVPLTLILNELVTNSCKYAFEEVVQPVIKLQLDKLTESGKLRLHYVDNGPGINPGIVPTSGFGTQLINSLSGQLGGKNKYWADQKGAHFELVFTIEE